MNESTVRSENESDIEPELLSLQSKLVGEIKRDETQVEVLLKRVDKSKALLHAVNQRLGAALTQATGYGAWADTMRAAVEAIGKDTFTATDVEEIFRSKFPTVQMDKSRIRGSLWTLARKKQKIMLSRKGTNKTPAEYMKLEAGGGTASGDGRGIRKRTRLSSGIELLTANGQ